jgi:hypothetical protein
VNSSDWFTSILLFYICSFVERFVNEKRN